MNHPAFGGAASTDRDVGSPPETNFSPEAFLEHAERAPAQPDEFTVAADSETAARVNALMVARIADYRAAMARLIVRRKHLHTQSRAGAEPASLERELEELRVRAANLAAAREAMGLSALPEADILAPPFGDCAGSRVLGDAWDIARRSHPFLRSA